MLHAQSHRAKRAVKGQRFGVPGEARANAFVTDGVAAVVEFGHRFECGVAGLAAWLG